MDLRDFLLARFAEDEQLARACTTWTEHAPSMAGCEGHHDPARDLAKCKAVRLIVEAEPERWVAQQDAPNYTIDMGCPEGMVRVYGKLLTETEFRDRYMELAPPSQTLLFLALPYADHADFQSEWAEALAEAA